MIPPQEEHDNNIQTIRAATTNAVSSLENNNHNNHKHENPDPPLQENTNHFNDNDCTTSNRIGKEAENASSSFPATETPRSLPDALPNGTFGTTTTKKDPLPNNSSRTTTAQPSNDAQKPEKYAENDTTPTNNNVVEEENDRTLQRTTSEGGGPVDLDITLSTLNTTIEIVPPSLKAAVDSNPIPRENTPRSSGNDGNGGETEPVVRNSDSVPSTRRSSQPVDLDDTIETVVSHQTLSSTTARPSSKNNQQNRREEETTCTATAAETTKSSLLQHESGKEEKQQETDPTTTASSPPPPSSSWVNEGLQRWERARHEWLGMGRYRRHGYEHGHYGGDGNGSDNHDGKDETKLEEEAPPPPRPGATSLDVDEIIDIIFLSSVKASSHAASAANVLPTRFPVNVPLPQMVDILQDLWEAEGLDA